MTIKRMINALLFTALAGVLAIVCSSFLSLHFHKKDTQNTIITIEHFSLAIDAQQAVHHVKSLINKHNHHHEKQEKTLKKFKEYRGSLYHLLPLLYLPRNVDKQLLESGDQIADELYDLVDIWLDNTQIHLKSDRHSSTEDLLAQSEKIDELFIKLFSVIHQSSIKTTLSSGEKTEKVSHIILTLTLLLFSVCSFYLIKVSKKTTDGLMQLVNSMNNLTNGETYTSIPFIDEKGDIGNIARAISIFKNKLIELSETNDEIDYVANHDPLTGVANRRYLEKYFRKKIQNKKENTFLFYLDLDDFKYINEYYGNKTGDKVLVSTVQGIEKNLRENDFLARIGGNEFILLINLGSNSNTIDSFGERLIRSINTPLQKDNVSIIPNVSIGISMFPKDGKTLDELTKNARIALDDVKKNNRNSFLRINDHLKEKSKNSKNTLKELKLALENQEIIPYFQPQMCIDKSEVSSFEALARWQHPQKGILTPYHFIDDASSTELIEKIGQAILGSCIDSIKTWKAMGFPKVKVSINVSQRELSNPNFSEKVIEKLTTHNIDASNVAFEVLETVTLSSNNQFILKNLSQLYNYGIDLYVDDFGIGYSSISSLQRSQFQKIKIDRCFACSHQDRERDKILLKSMIGLAKSLQISSLVEGVETEEQLDLIREYGADQVQGYLLSKPLSFEDATSWWKENLSNNQKQCNI